MKKKKSLHNVLMWHLTQLEAFQIVLQKCSRARNSRNPLQGFENIIRKIHLHSVKSHFCYALLWETTFASQTLIILFSWSVVLVESMCFFSQQVIILHSLGSRPYHYVNIDIYDAHSLIWHLKCINLEKGFVRILPSIQPCHTDCQLPYCLKQEICPHSVHALKKSVHPFSEPDGSLLRSHVAGA